MRARTSSNPALGQPDHVHYTRDGCERLGEVILGALMEGFDGRREVPPASEGDPATATASSDPAPRRNGGS